jgi:hypothetical protein
MADNPDDLVSNVSVTGVDDTSSTLKRMGDEGAAAFDKLAASAKTAGEEITAAAKEIEIGTTSILKASPADGAFTQRLSDIRDAVVNLKATMSAAGSDIAGFAAKIEGLGAVGLVALTGITKFAASVTNTYRTIGEVSKDSLRDQQALDKQGIVSVQQANTYNASLGKLHDQLKSGQLNYVTYATAVTALNKATDQQVAAQERVAAAQEDARKKNDMALNAQRERVALNELTKAYGGPLTNSLIELGKTYEELHKEVVTAFSPALASLVDKVSEVIKTNQVAISKFLDEASKGFADFIKNNGPFISQFFTTMADTAKALGTILKDVIVPAMHAMGDAAQWLADHINEVFGTKLTSGAVIAAAAVIYFSGAIGTVIAVVGAVVSAIAFLITVFTPLGLVIGIVVIALIAFAASVNWTKLGADIKTAFTAVVDFFKNLPDQIGAFFTTLWEGAKKMASDAATWVIDKWNAVVVFFQSIPDTVSQFFSDLWEKVKSITQAAFDSIKATINSWVQSALASIQPVLDGIKTIKDWLSSDQGGSGGSQTASSGFAEGGLIRGPGTPTSDSIPIWASDREFMVKARSVAKYGLGFMQAVNNGTLDLGKMLGYAAGGLVQSMSGNPVPKLAFAEGGQVTSHASRVLNLSIGGEQFNGLLMPDDVANKMTKFAVGRQTTSAGRKPAWVGGPK